MEKFVEDWTWLLVTPALFTVVIAIWFYFGCTPARIAEKEAQLGEQAVMLLYDFGTVEQLDDQMRGLKEITTEPVFNQLTIDNEERTLNTYLKFNSKSVTVEILKSTDSYVLYKLHSESISSGRLFLFLFSVDKSGRIDEVREVEAIDFVKTIN